ncbi:MAG: hypothetical protein ICV87_13680, partial [Gemmatimonadetes bacterium]|nr:hypothetical protein [Gemmatimonadota bacterium]
MASNLPRSEPSAREDRPVVELPSVRRVPPVLDSALPYGPEPVNLQEAFDVLRRHAALIVAAAIATTAAALVWAMMAVPEYEARAMVRLKDDRGALTSGLSEAAPVANILMGRTTDPLLSEVEVLKSPAVAKRVVDAEGLRLRAVERGFPAST